MSTELQQVTTAVAEFDKVAAGLAELKSRYAGIVYDFTKPGEMERAKKDRLEIRSPRYEIERIRKEAKVPILALGKKLDSEAARITAEILAVEEPIDRQIKGEEDRKEAEKQAKIQAELKRVEDLQARVAELRGNQSLTSLSDPALIAEHIGDLERIAVDDSFQEFRQQAQDAKSAGLARLRQLHAAALAHQAEQERIRQEREELARLRAAEEQRQAAERARIAEEERKAKAERDAETARQAEALRLQREEQERAAAAELARLKAEREENERIARERQAELDRQEAERQAALKAEQERLAAERAAFERQQEEARRQREAEERQRAEQARIAALQKPGDEELIGVLCAHYRAPREKVVEWILSMDLSFGESAAA